MKRLAITLGVVLLVLAAFIVAGYFFNALTLMIILAILAFISTIILTYIFIVMVYVRKLPIYMQNAQFKKIKKTIKRFYRLSPSEEKFVFDLYKEMIAMLLNEPLGDKKLLSSQALTASELKTYLAYRRIELLYKKELSLHSEFEHYLKQITKEIPDELKLDLLITKALLNKYHHINDRNTLYDAYEGVEKLNLTVLPNLNKEFYQLFIALKDNKEYSSSIPLFNDFYLSLVNPSNISEI